MATSITLEEIITFLLETPMFGDLDAAELSEVVHIMQVQRLPAGSVFFREGDAGDAWYVVFEGAVEVLKGEDVIAVLGPRTCFGEMAILDGSPRSATVRAGDGTAVFRFPRADFTRLLNEGNLSAYKLVYQIALILAARQRATTAQLVEVVRSKMVDVSSIALLLSASARSE